MKVRLATIKVVSDQYPLRGSVRISDTLFGEQRAVDGIPPRGEVWADGALLARVGADVGGTLAVGGLDLKISAVLTYRPDQSIGFASLAPSLILNIGDIAESGLIGEGSRVRYALLVAGDEQAVALTSMRQYRTVCPSRFESEARRTVASVHTMQPIAHNDSCR